MNNIKTNLLISIFVFFPMIGICMADTFKDSQQDILASNVANSLSASAVVSETEERVKETVFERLKSKGIRFQLGPGLSGNDAAPASFAFDRNIQEGTDTSFNAAFTLGWRPSSSLVNFKDLSSGEIVTSKRGSHRLFGKRNITWDWDSSIQGNLTTGADAEADAWVFRLGVVIDHNNPRAFITQLEYENEIFELLEQGYDTSGATAELRRRYSGKNASFFKGSWWSLAGKLEADRDFDNQRLSLELEMTPTTSILGNGILWPSRKAKKDASMRFIWRPYFGVDIGEQISSDGTIDKVDDTLRGIGRVTAGLSLDSLAKVLGVPGVDIKVENTTNYLTSSKDSYNYLEAQLAFKINKNLGFSLKYVDGEKAPNFEKVETFGGAFTVKF